MAANTEPIFTKTPVFKVAQISTANTNRDGTGTTSELVVGSENGTRITRITVQSTGSPVSAGMVRVFLVSGAVTALFEEFSVTATIPSNSAVGFRSKKEYIGEKALILPSGVSLRASTSIGEPFNVFAEGGDY